LVALGEDVGGVDVLVVLIESDVAGTAPRDHQFPEVVANGPPDVGTSFENLQPVEDGLDGALGFFR
jgi:hypothetical protein